MGVEFSPKVARRDIDEGLVDQTNNLVIVRSCRKLNSSEGAGGYETRAVTGFGAPSDLLCLRITDSRATLRGSPDAEI